MINFKFGLDIQIYNELADEVKFNKNIMKRFDLVRIVEGLTLSNVTLDDQNCKVILLDPKILLA